MDAVSIVTVILTKMMEKLGEKIGEKLPDLGGQSLKKISQLKQMLWQIDPETASDIEKVNSQPELFERQPENYSLQVLTEKIASVAQQQPEFRELLEAIAEEVKPQLPTQLMVVGLKVQGNFKTKNMTQKAKTGVLTNQSMLSDVEIGMDLTIEDLIQEG